MKSYFKITDNNIDNSTVFSEEELKQNFPSHNFDTSPPEGYIEYKISKSPRLLNPYDKIEIVGYEFESDNCVKDIITIVQITGEEKQRKIEQIKAEFLAKHNRPTWKFNETFGGFEPPEYPPRDGWVYTWDEKTQCYRNTGLSIKDSNIIAKKT